MTPSQSCRKQIIYYRRSDTTLGTCSRRVGPIVLVADLLDQGLCMCVLQLVVAEVQLDKKHKRSEKLHADAECCSTGYGIQGLARVHD